MFCPQCGTKIDEPVNFCPECGENLIGMFPEHTNNQPEHTNNQPEQANNQSEQTDVSSHNDYQPQQSIGSPETTQNSNAKIVAKGFLFTNLSTLSSFLNTDKKDLQEVLQKYTKALQNVGVFYQLVDAGDYTYKKRGVFGAKTVHLKQTDSWSEYADILFDLNQYEKKQGLQQTDYLFILGGTNIVPMPRVPHYYPDSDKDFDTDLLYAYPYGEQMVQDMYSLKIFRYDALFYVGRLPLVGGREGATDLINYLNRALSCANGIPANRLYIQCDPNWQKVTSGITRPLREKMQVRTSKPLEDIVYEGSVLSPYIHTNDSGQLNTERWFDTNAQFIFFNMHGSNAMDSSGFFGQEKGRGRWCEGSNPHILSLMEQPNILFTQACYGGRFIGYDKRHSMLLTALATNTLCYVGSSRIAEGNVDVALRGQNIVVMRSDVLALKFGEYVTEGFSVGAAFFKAKQDTFRIRNSSELIHNALTIGEFNLFGDPTLHILSDRTTYKTSKDAIGNGTEKIELTGVETVLQKNADHGQSMLEQLRAQVNKNIQDICQSISSKLYSEYGIEAREPFFVQKMKFSNGDNNLILRYDNGTEGSIQSSIIVTTDEKGNNIQVCATKYRK